MDWTLTPTGVDFSFVGAGVLIGGLACTLDPVCDLAAGVVIAGTVIYISYEALPSLVQAVQNAYQNLKGCTPLGPPIGEPSTTYKGATSWVQKYVCPDGRVYEEHWIEKNATGTVKHGPHYRPQKPRPEPQ